MSDRMVYVIEQKFNGGDSWTPCDSTLWYRKAHRTRRMLVEKWPDFKFRVKRYFPQEQP